MGFNHLKLLKGMNVMAEYGLISLYLAIFGLPAAFSFGVMWASTGRDKQ